MDPAALIVFTSALLFAAIVPGPAVTAVIARVIGRGLEGVVPFVTGIILGDLVWLAIAVLGLSLLAQAFELLFAVVKYAGAAYLLYLAYRLWTAPPQAIDAAPDRRAAGSARLFFGGLALTLGNPKTVAFYLALTPTLIDVQGVTVTTYAELALVIVAVLAMVFTAYVLSAFRARVLFRSTRSMRVLNRASGTLMAGAAVAVASR